MKPEAEKTFGALLALFFRFVRICSAPGLRSSTVFPVAFARLPAITSASTLVESLRTWGEFYEETHPDMISAEVTGENLRQMAAMFGVDSQPWRIFHFAANELDHPGSLICSSEREPSDRPWAVAAFVSEQHQKESDPLSVAFTNVLLETPNVPPSSIDAARIEGKEAGRRFVETRLRSFDASEPLDRGWAIEAFACSNVACEMIAHGLSLDYVESIFLDALVSETVAALVCDSCKGQKSERRTVFVPKTNEQRIELFCYSCENDSLRRLGAEAGKP